MIRHLLIASAATLALTAPVAAERGGGKGDGGQSAKAERGGGGQAAAKRGGGERRQSARTERRNGGERARAQRQNSRPVRFAQAERGNDKRNETRMRGQDRKEDRRSERQAQNRVERREQRAENRNRGRADDRQARMVNRGEDRRVVRARDMDDRRLARARGSDDRRVRVRNFDNDDRWVENFARGVNGCPPGLANKNPACMPPGQYKKWEGNLLPAALKSSMLPLALRDVWRDNDDYYYRYNNAGYVYRVDRDNDLVSALLPLFGGGLGLGQVYPSSYSAYAMPSYYQPFYRDTADDYYRYANGYMYEIDRDNGLIEDIIPLYDQGYGVGQMLPPAYSYYNLPYQYRSSYMDDDDYYYRYAPGAIYQVDRDTSLITTIASLLMPGLGVGQQLPMGYDVYNVPYQYRAQYYDTPDSWYRYGNGNIYQIDPTTRLITAVVAALV